MKYAATFHICYIPFKLKQYCTMFQILSMLDFGRECWIYREDWIKSGIHVGRGRKYKDSYYLHALAMSYISS